MDRKKFLRHSAAAVLGGVALGSCSQREADIQKIDISKKYKWKMVTTWPPNFPVIH